MLGQRAAATKATELLNQARTEHARLRKFERYARGRQKMPWLPDNVESEYRDIAVKSASNWLDLVIRATGQGMYVDGFTAGPDHEEATARVWSEVWQANGMDARQHALHRAVLTLGYSHLIVFPAEGGGVWMRPEAATAMAAVFADPSDEWPVMAARKVSKTRVELYTDDARYIVDDGRTVEVLPHDLGFCPVVEMRSAIDLMGKPMGEVEGVIPIQDRIVDATFTLQMVAKYGAFPQRWIAGADLARPLVDDNGDPVLDGDGNPVFPTIKAYVDHIITAADPDTKFGQFAAADLRQYVDALEAHIRHLAAITQTPPHYLLGSLVNLSAEALAAAEAGLQRKIAEKRVVFGEGYEQALRAAASIIGEQALADDPAVQVRWRDVESRSLAQSADALGKIATMLQVPPQVLWSKIPGFTDQDIAEAKRVADDMGGLNALFAQIENAQTPGDDLAVI